jgi:hypothetical protein
MNSPGATKHPTRPGYEFCAGRVLVAQAKINRPSKESWTFPDVAFIDRTFPDLSPWRITQCDLSGELKCRAWSENV